VRAAAFAAALLVSLPAAAEVRLVVPEASAPRTGTFEVIFLNEGDAPAKLDAPKTIMVAEGEAALEGPLAPAIAFNDHTSMAMLHPGTPLQDRPFDHDPAFPVVDAQSPAFLAKMDGRAKRSHMPAADYVALLCRIWERRAEVLPVIAEVARKGAAAGAPMLSHDDSQPETRAFYRGIGARISEFPVNLRTAEAARAAGDRIVFGAPNAARGGSHLGSPGAADMVAAGLCDILASDYYYPAMLAAVARLQADGVGALAEMWKLVSANPAAALALQNRGGQGRSRRSGAAGLARRASAGGAQLLCRGPRRLWRDCGGLDHA